MRATLAALAALIATAPLAPPAHAEQAQQRQHVVLVTIDGLRWQELFRGADPALVEDERYRARYVDVSDRAAALTPFLLSFRERGALIGDRGANSCARVANEFWFSYPGYAEILQGRPNPHARSNEKKPNPERTVLERLAQRPEFANEVRVFAEWSAVPFIINAERSGIPVVHPPQDISPHDPFVRESARAVIAELPRVTWIAFGDTDNRAHEGDYDAYLAAATDADQYLAELWAAIEADPKTAGRTTMIVTTDHGRGEAENNKWRGHGSGRWRRVIVPGLRREGSDAVFIAARGPTIRAGAGEIYNLENCATSSQIAATLLSALGLHAELAEPDMAPPLDVFTPR